MCYGQHKRALFSVHVKCSHNRFLLNPHCFAWETGLPRFPGIIILTTSLFRGLTREAFKRGEGQATGMSMHLQKNKTDLCNKFKSHQLKWVLSKSHVTLKNPLTVEKQHPQTKYVPKIRGVDMTPWIGFPPKVNCRNQAFQESYHTQWWQRKQKTSLNTGTYFKIRQTVFWKHAPSLSRPATTATASMTNSN